MTFEEASLLPRSEKISLVIARATKLVKLFDIYDTDVYSRSVPYFVESVLADGNLLTLGSSKDTLSLDEYYFSSTEMVLYISVDSDPKNLDISLNYKIFFSNAPIILPHDLATGHDVEWLPYIESIGDIGQQLDDENTGIVLESQSSLTLLNNDGYFDEIFDTLIWENKQVEFYTWFPVTHISQARKIFEGVIESKDFDQSKVVFKVKDFVYRLRNFVDLPLFSDTDGTLPESLKGTPKRRIYGQAKQVKLPGVDNMLSGFTIDGTVLINLETDIMTGTGTDFLNQLSVGDEIVFTVSDVNYKFGIATITSATDATINKTSEINIINLPVIVSPVVPYREYNRVWNVAGHKLREPTSTITSVVSNNRFIVSSTSDLFNGDQVLINNDLVTIRRVSGNEIVTQSAVSPLPSVSDLFIKLPVQRVYFGPKELIYGRDWDYTNTTEAIVTIDPLAEFNITQEKLLGVSVTFTNSSRSITTVSTADFRSILKSRDWIRKNTIVSGENTWHEILEVKEQEIILRDNYTGSTATTTALIKAVDYIADDSLITADCLGMEVSGLWIKTPSDAVRHLILNDGEFDAVNETSFAKAKADCDYILSIIIPETIEGDSPTIREVITNINESCFGSLYGNQTLDISYSILNSDKPEVTNIVKDDDIISFSSESSTEIYNNIQIFFRPFTDLITGNDSFESTSYNSGFVDNYIGIKNRLEKTVYLYEEDKAQIIAQRFALFKSLTNTKISIKGKMSFFLNSINDKVFLSLDRLYKRFGGEDRRKIGIITSIKKSQTEVDLTFSDLGNIFNRVPAIAPNDANDFSTSDSDEKIRWGYIVDSNTELPDNTSELYINTNIIG